MWDLNDLKDSVSKILVTTHDFTIEEAEETVNDSATNKPELWHENSDPSDLAKYLAEEGDDE